MFPDHERSPAVSGCQLGGAAHTHERTIGDVSRIVPVQGGRAHSRPVLRYVNPRVCTKLAHMCGRDSFVINAITYACNTYGSNLAGAGIALLPGTRQAGSAGRLLRQRQGIRRGPIRAALSQTGGSMPSISAVRQDPAMPGGAPVIIAASAQMLDVLAMARRAAAGVAKVLITGESGVGKDLIARQIHLSSARATGPFVAVNCAGFAETLLESELFGHAKGSFTGAHRDKQGQLQMAHRGTLFLDEVGEMSLRMQALLLRFLETGEVHSVGAHHAAAPVNVRVVGPRTAIWRNAWHRAISARIFSIACGSSTSTSHRSATGTKTCPCSSTTC